RVLARDSIIPLKVRPFDAILSLSIYIYIYIYIYPNYHFTSSLSFGARIWTSLLPGVGLGQKFGLGTLARNRSSGFGRLLVEEPDLVEVKELDNEPARGFWLRKAETPALSLGCWHLTFRVLGQHAAASGPGLTGCFSDAARIDLTEPAPSSLSAPEAASSRARTSHLVEGSVGERTGSRSERKEIQEDYFLQDNNCTRRNDRRRRRACGRSTLASWNERRQRRLSPVTCSCDSSIRPVPRDHHHPRPSRRRAYITSPSTASTTPLTSKTATSPRNVRVRSRRPSEGSFALRPRRFTVSATLDTLDTLDTRNLRLMPLLRTLLMRIPVMMITSPPGKRRTTLTILLVIAVLRIPKEQRHSGSTLMQQHPYNEYTWDVNAINPWLSACDLAGPAPADLQGTCGPPEVPKYCPMPCKGQGDAKKIFLEAVQRLHVPERSRTGNAKTYGKWKPLLLSSSSSESSSLSSSSSASGNSAAPDQCLFYLEESHKEDICREDFARSDSLSFLTPKENRYWFVSGLRLRHCCEHAAVNALAPGKGGPLEDVLNGGRKCVNALDKLLSVDALAARLHCEFGEVLARYDCAQQYSVIHNCTHCK
ncbi:GSCOCG00006606001-RA-CDS, partial [Cotesia congregata]